MPERFSRAKKHDYKDSESERWMIGFDYLVFLFIVGIGAVFSMVITYGTSNPLTQVSIMQMIFALLGLVLFLFANSYPELNIRSGLPTSDDVETQIRWFFIIFPILLIMTTFFTVTMQSIIGVDLQIALTSAIVEEALYAAGIGCLLLNVLLAIMDAAFGSVSFPMRILMELIAAIAVALFFALSHIGAYGLSFRHMITLFVNRLAYQMAFYRTRNLMLPTLMHVFNNWLVFAI